MSDPTLKGNKNSLQLPTNSSSINIPAALPQKLSSNGSATGNPRNKCALKPGHSLMDWIRLGNSGVDLTGFHGRIVPVTSEELAKHNKIDDAWIALRGKVFNVTRYIDFHPGGAEELMRGAGRDATKLFDEVHAWVNYPQLLAKCYIGPLKTLTKAQSNACKPLLQKIDTAAFDLCKPPLPEIVPRFDWIQNRTDLSLYIYTRQFANPGIVLRRIDDNVLQMRLKIFEKWHHFDFKLHESVCWPPRRVTIGSETGKIEIVLFKTTAAPWITYGTHTTMQTTHDAEELEDFELVSKGPINRDSIELSFRNRNQNMIFVPPIGSYLDIQTALNDHIVQRSYTPLNKHIMPLARSSEHDFNLNFLIKVYTHGEMSSHLKQLQCGAVVQLSMPRGNFNLQKLVAHRNILLLAAGSGLTPHLNLLEPLLKRNTNRLESLNLLYFNKTQDDIWVNNTLIELQKSDARFVYQNILSQPDEAWSGRTGRITKDLLMPFLDKSKQDAITFVVICGPSGFNVTSVNLLKELNFNSVNLHVF